MADVGVWILKLHPLPPFDCHESASGWPFHQAAMRTVFWPAPAHHHLLPSTVPLKT